MGRTARRAAGSGWLQQGLVQQNARKGLTLTQRGGHAGADRLERGAAAEGDHLEAAQTDPSGGAGVGPPPSAANLARLGRADGMRAVLVQKQLGLPSPGARSLAQVRDAVCWRQLGVETDKPFTLAAVQPVLLGRALQATREVAPAQALQQLAARASARGARIRRVFGWPPAGWTMPAAQSSPSPSTSTRRPPSHGAPLGGAGGSGRKKGLHAFAERVLQVALGRRRAVSATTGSSSPGRACHEDALAWTSSPSSACSSRPTRSGSCP